jgi:hypothetical protein
LWKNRKAEFGLTASQVVSFGFPRASAAYVSPFGRAREKKAGKGKGIRYCMAHFPNNGHNRPSCICGKAGKEALQGRVSSGRQTPGQNIDAKASDLTAESF